MQRCKSIAVLIIKILHPAQQVDESDLSFGVSSPVHGCAPSIVSAAQVEPTQLEEVNRNRLVALRSHMQHIDTKVVLSVDVCSMINQKLTNVWVALERGEMQSCKAIPVVLLVDPRGDLLLQEVLRVRIVQQHLHTLRAVIKGALVNECFAARVDDLIDAQFEIAI